MERTLINQAGERAPRVAFFRFYASLNDFLPQEKQRLFAREIKDGVSVKSAIEEIGIPHTEVDLILINGESAGFSSLLQDGDVVSVYPVFAALDVAGVSRVRPAPLREYRFVLDGHLGKLASYLRMLGFDVSYERDRDDRDLARCSHNEERILLTRDRGLLKRGEVTYGCCVRSTDPAEQLLEVVNRYDLLDRFRPFRRCLSCNGILEPVSKESIAGMLSPEVDSLYNEFSICGDCRQIYWKGTHHERMERFIRDLVNKVKGH